MAFSRELLKNKRDDRSFYFAKEALLANQICNYTYYRNQTLRLPNDQNEHYTFDRCGAYHNSHQNLMKKIRLHCQFFVSFLKLNQYYHILYNGIHTALVSSECHRLFSFPVSIMILFSSSSIILSHMQQRFYTSVLFRHSQLKHFSFL